MTWVEKEWYAARWISPGRIDGWLGQRPVYAWADGAAWHARYVEEPATGLPGMVRVVERRK